MAITRITHNQINNIVPFCGLNLTTAQSVTDANRNAIAWDTDNFDNFSMHNPSSNPERITAPEAGKYLVSCLICWSGGTGVSQANIFLSKNGSSDIESSGDTMLDARRYLCVQSVVDLDASDYIYIDVQFVGNSGTVSLRGNECGIEVVKIGE